jgi:hypothetical protein
MGAEERVLEARVLARFGIFGGRIASFSCECDNETMSGDEASLQVDLAEFNALRAEIQTFLNLQSAFLGLAVAVIVAVIQVAASQPAGRRPWMVAATPLPFAILATLYADVGARVGRAARYIQATIRPRLARQTAPHDALGWEQYVHKDDPNKKLLWLTDKFRYAMFFLPAILAYVVSFWWPAPTSRDPYFKTMNGVALLGASSVVWRSEVVLKEILSKRKH